MAITEALRLVIDADARGAVKGIEDVGRAADRSLGKSEQRLDRWGGRLTTVGAGLVAFGAVAAAGLNQAVQSAGELEQAVGGTEAVFGEASGAIDAYAENAADKVGLSQTAFRNLSTVVGAQLKNLGLSVDDAADRSIQLVEVGADLAATFGGTTQEAVEALGAAFRGEADPAERFGLRLNQTAVNAKAVELGLAASTSQVDANAKAQATLALIMEQSADAQGQFSRESDTLAGRQQRLTAQFEDLKAEIGAGALPVMETLFSTVSRGIGVFSGLNDASGGALGQIATIGTVASLGVGGLSLLVGQAIKMRVAISDARDAVSKFITRARGLGAGGGILAGVSAGLLAAAAAFEEFNNAEGRANVEGATQEFLAAGESIDEMRAALEKVSGSGFGLGLGTGATEVIDLFGELASTNREAAERFVDFVEAGGAADSVVQQMRDHLETLDEAEQQTTEDTEAAAAATEGLGGAMGEAGEETATAEDALKEFNTALDELQDRLFGTDHAAIEVEQGFADLAEMVKTANEEAGGFNATLDISTQAGRDNKLALDELVGAHFSNIEAMAEAGATQDQLNAANATFKDRLIATMVQMGFTEGQARDYASQLNLIPGAVSTLVSAQTAAASSAVETYRRSLAGIPRNINVRIVTSYDVPSYQTFGGGQATGGIVPGGYAAQGRIVPGPRGSDTSGPWWLTPGEMVLTDSQQGRLWNLIAGRQSVSAAGGGMAGGGGSPIVIDARGAIIANDAQFERMVARAFANMGEHGRPVTYRGRRIT